METNYKSLFIMLLLTSSMAFSQQIVLFDFGPLADVAAANLNYNNTEDPLAGGDGTPIADLINNTGAASGIGYEITDRFTFRNTSGTQTPSGDAAAAFDSQATRDSFFGNTGDFNGDIEPTGAFKLTGLDNNKFYSFEVFASRATTENREAKYTVTGSSTVIGFLNAGDNVANTVLINDVKPTGGEITFLAEPGPNNNNSLGFYYLGAIKMTESDAALAIDEAILEANGLNVYPNPVGEELNIDYRLSDYSISEISVFDITGRLVFNVKNNENQIGTYSFKWNRLDNNGSKLAAGTYFVKLQTETKAFSKKLILK